MVVLHWVYFVAYLVAAVVIDMFAMKDARPGWRQGFRAVVLVVGAVWVLRLVGVIGPL